MRAHDTHKVHNDDDGKVIAQAARYAVITESKKTTSAGYQVVRTSTGSTVWMEGCKPVDVKRGGIDVQSGRRYTFKAN